MWFNIIKNRPTKPATKGSQKTYVKRLVERFIEETPTDTKFSANTVLKFYNSPTQQKYKFEDWEPLKIQIVTHLNGWFPTVKGRVITVNSKNIDYYKQYDVTQTSGNAQTIYVKGDWDSDEGIAPIINPEDMTKEEYDLLSMEDKYMWHGAMVYKYRKEGVVDLRKFHIRMYKRIKNSKGVRSRLPIFFSLEEMEAARNV